MTKNIYYFIDKLILTITLITLLVLIYYLIVQFSYELLFITLCLLIIILSNTIFVKRKHTPVFAKNETSFDNNKLLKLIENNIEPETSLLIPNEFFAKSEVKIETEETAKYKADIIISTLAKMKIGAEFKKFTANASVTTLMFKGLDYIDENDKVYSFDNSKINYALENIKLNLGTTLVNFIPVVEGESLFAFQIKSTTNNIINFGNIVEKLQRVENELNYIVGQKTDGNWLYTNMITHPHSLIIGATNSGKSTFANSMICQLLITKTPNELELWISDNKIVEFAAYADLPHTKYFAKSYDETLKMLSKLIDIESQRSNVLFQTLKVKNIVSYNKKVSPDQRLPFIVVIIDEFPTLVETDNKVRGKPFMSDLNILLSKARAAGIYINILTQNAKATTIDTTLRGNLQCRIVLSVADSNDSTTAGVKGADLLNGFGDLIFKLNQYQERAQAPFISDDDIDKLITFIMDKY